MHVLICLINLLQECDFNQTIFKFPPSNIRAMPFTTQHQDLAPLGRLQGPYVGLPETNLWITDNHVVLSMVEPYFAY